LTAARRSGKPLTALLPCRKSADKKMRPLSDAATDGDRFGALDRWRGAWSDAAAT